VYVKANRMGLHKAPVGGRADRAERTVCWSKEPEMEAWMMEHDRGQRIDELQREFRERWGFGLSRGQINLFRASHGKTVRKGHGGRHRVPVGSERPSKDGYLVISDKPGLGIDVNVEEIEKRPYKPRNPRHYTGTLTDIRPKGDTFYFFDGLDCEHPVF
jgi:hypothetical protein